LSDALVARGLVSEDVVEAALAASRDGRPYGEILIADGSIAEVDFARAMADHHGVDHVDLDLFDIDPLATALVAKEIARRNGAVPIAVLVTGEVVVAIHDPALTNLVEIADVTGSRIRAVIASRSQIERHLDGALRPVAAAPAPPQAVRVQPAQEPPAPAPALATMPDAPEPAPEPAPPYLSVFAPSPVPDLSVSAPSPVPDLPMSAPALVTVPDLPEPAPELPAGGFDEPVAARMARDVALRLAAAERSAREADERARLAEHRAEGLIDAAQAASDALAEVSKARADADDAARASAQLIDALQSELAELRTKLDTERETRRRVEAELQSLRSAATLVAPALAIAPAPANVLPFAPPTPAPVAPPPQAAIAAVAVELPAPPAGPAPGPRPVSSSPPAAPPSSSRPRPAASSKKRGLRRMIAALRRS
jgi:hypothetical protein